MAAIVDETGNDVPNGQGGILVVKKPWPSMIRTIWGDPERFKKSYYPPSFKGYYLAGDGAIRDAKTGYFTITGRIDDVLNVSGHRMGTMEIESALVSCTELVAEAAVVGRPTTPPARPSAPSWCSSARARPATRPRRSPTSCATGWPRRSARSPSPRTSASATTCPRPARGKIMRRLLRSIAKGEAITQDTSTLENPAILEQLAAGQLSASAVPCACTARVGWGTLISRSDVSAHQSPAIVDQLAQTH
jgi:acetyl-CoA synthetase